MEDNLQGLQEWGADLEQRISAAKTRGSTPALASPPRAPLPLSDQRPHGFDFSWPPQDNPKNRSWRRALRAVLVRRSWYALASHKSESAGGCTKCYAVEATQLGAEAPGFVHKHCYYCRAGYLG